MAARAEDPNRFSRLFVVPLAGEAGRVQDDATFVGSHPRGAETLVALKELMISELNLAGKQPADIDDTAPLFGAGLGLDSLDALQLAMCVEERFGVKIPEGKEARNIFASVTSLAAHVLRVSAPSSPPGDPGPVSAAKGS